MLFTTFSQLIALAILFIGGLLLGLGLHPGSAKWRQRLKEESDNYARFRSDADVRLREANQRIAELEREKTGLQESEAAARKSLADAQLRLADADRRGAAGRTATTETATAVVHPVRDPDLAGTTAVARDGEDRKGWFGGTATPELDRIRGIDPALKTSLAGLGVTRLQDITDLSAEDEIALEQRLSLPAGYIAREQWREQAVLLRDGHDAEQAARFPAR